MKYTLYLVGHKDSKEKNDWLAMTNSEAEAQRLLKELKGATQVVPKEYKK